MNTTQVCEATSASTGTVTERGVVPIALITPGWGSSGYYSAEVLENAAKTAVFPKGTHMYWDHPSESERSDRPERSVRDLVAVLESDATWDGTALIGESKVFQQYREAFKDPDFVAAIGVSIRALAEYHVGEAEGRKGTIIENIAEAQSVDFVTRPGRGGAVLSVLESARETSESSANDTNEALQNLLVSTYGGDKTYVWVRDFDSEAGKVWYSVQTDDNAKTYEHSFSMSSAGAASLGAGEPVEVRQHTEYVPVAAAAEALKITVTSVTEGATSPTDVPAPAGQSTATESQGDDMAATQIEEAELGRLRSDAERVPTLESERDTAIQERDAAREESATIKRTLEAERLIATVEGANILTPLEKKGLLSEIPVTESGEFDTEKFTTTVTEAAATAAESAGAGRIRGFGSTFDASLGSVSEADVDAAVGSAFGHTPKGA